MRTAFGDSSPFSGQTHKPSAEALMRSNRVEPAISRLEGQYLLFGRVASDA